MPLPRKQSIAGPAVRRAVSASATVIDAKTRRFQLTWASEDVAYLRSNWFDEPWMETLGLDPSECDLSRLNSGSAPLLWGHDDYSRGSNIGVIEKAWLKDGRGYANARLSMRADVDGIVQDVDDGILTNVSTSYQIQERTLTKQNEGAPDEYRVTRWLPLEISLVSIPVDDTVGVGRSNEPPAKFTITELGVTNMPATNGQAAIENRAADVTAASTDPGNTVPATQLAAAPATEGAERPAAAQTPREEGGVARSLTEADVQRHVAQATTAERVRVTEIRSIARDHDLGDAFAEEQINGGKPITEVRAAALKKLSEGSTGGQTPRRIEIGVEQVQTMRNMAANWLLQRVGQVNGMDGKPLNMQGNEYRGMSLLDLAKDRLAHAGVSTRGLDVMEVAQRAITHSTSDFPIILGNVFNKILLAAYGIVPDTFRTFVKIGSVSDFRASNRYRMGTFGDLALIPEGGEYTYGTISDAEKNPASITTKGKIFSVTRQLIINDDMGALTNILELMGRGAKRGLEKDFYALLALNSGAGPTMADGNALFSVAHSNLQGTPSAPTIATLAAEDQAMRQQSFGGDYIDVGPSSFLSTIALAAQVALLNKSVYDDTANKFQKPNQVFNLFTSIVGTPRLPNATQWYIFADPNVEPVIELDFLNGQQEPVTEQRDGWNVDGIEYKIRFDYGFNAVGYRGARRNPGA